MLLLSQELGIPGFRCLAPAELRAHMEERFARALEQGHAVGALLCDLRGLEVFELSDPCITPRVLGALALTLETVFRAPEVIVHRDEGHLAVLLIGPDPMRIEAACREWMGGAKELRIDGLDGPLGLSPRIGYGVTQPGKRMFLDTLLQVAREGLRVARCRGPGACVHTMLYDVLQGRLEWERGTQGIVVSERPPSPERSAPTGQAAGESREDARAPQVSLVEPRREQELAQALEAQRCENEALRARLRALEELEPTPAESAQERIDVLERRLAKLRLSLAETEERLARTSRSSAVDPGVASCHRTVQGLDADAPHHARKTALLEQILAANLELRERLRSERREAS